MFVEVVFESASLYLTGVIFTCYRWLGYQLNKLVDVLFEFVADIDSSLVPGETELFFLLNR